MKKFLTATLDMAISVPLLFGGALGVLWFAAEVLVIVLRGIGNSM